MRSRRRSLLPPATARISVAGETPTLPTVGSELHTMCDNARAVVKLCEFFRVLGGESAGGHDASLSSGLNSLFHSPAPFEGPQDGAFILPEEIE